MVVRRALQFLRVIDEKAQLSITNLGVFAMALKIWQSGAISQNDLLALAAVLANYVIKKVIVYFEQRTPVPQTVDVQALNDSVAKLTTDLDDAKNKISSLSLAAGIRGIPSKPF